MVEFLLEARTGENVTWNFEQCLMNRFSNHWKWQRKQKNKIENLMRIIILSLAAFLLIGRLSFFFAFLLPFLYFGSYVCVCLPS